ncbi:MAG: response regulator [Bryobacteraceae bacterium]|nr:response regulator [Bryobacteraceae bacterium]
MGPTSCTPERPLRIGLVDDDVSIRRSLCRLIRAYGFDCVAYESGEAALADPAFTGADCLILDIQLPGISGFEVRRRLAEQGSPRPALFITAQDKGESAHWLRQLDGRPCLRKPFDGRLLISTIESVLSSGRGLSSTILG